MQHNIKPYLIDRQAVVEVSGAGEQSREEARKEMRKQKTKYRLSKWDVNML